MCGALEERRGAEKRASSFRNQTKDVSAGLFRVGLDQGIHVASNDVVLVLTIANETASEVILSADNGPVGGFRDIPLSTIKVNPGVSAKFPVVIARFPRAGENGELW